MRNGLPNIETESTVSAVSVIAGCICPSGETYPDSKSGPRLIDYLTAAISTPGERVIAASSVSAIGIVSRTMSFSSSMLPATSALEFRAEAFAKADS